MWHIMLFTAAAAGFSAFQLKCPHGHFVTAAAPAQPADPAALIVFHTAQGGEFTEFPSSQILGLQLGRILFRNAAAAGDISAYELPARCQSFPTAVALTVPADRSLAVTKAGIFHYGQMPELLPYKIGYI